MFCLILVWILKVCRKTDDHHFLLVTAQVWLEVNRIFFVGEWVEKKKKRRFKSSGSQRAWCPCRTRSEDPRCYKDESERKKNKVIVETKAMTAKRLLNTRRAGLRQMFVLPR